MTLAFNLILDDADIENKGTFCKALEQITNNMLNDDMKNAISVDVQDPDDNAEDEASANMVNITLNDLNGGSIEVFREIFNVVTSVLRKPDPNSAIIYVP